MAKAFYMHKIKEENGVYYYKVSDLRQNPTEFFVAINAQKKTISYFLTVDCKNPITVIDFNQTDRITTVPPFDTGIARSTFLLAGAQAFRAVKENNFPESMSKYS